MSARPWLKFYTSDWRADPALRMVSLGARGLWMEILCIMHEAEPYGHLLIKGRPVTPRQMAMLAGAAEPDVVEMLEELRSAGVFDEEDGRIVSRRMVRDFERDVANKEHGKGGGNPTLLRGTVPKEDRIRGYRRSDSPTKTRRIFDRSGGRCHWCQTALAWETGDAGAQFHVDHVIAIRDGGTNDEGNLVASCAACNHERARVGNKVGAPSAVIVGAPSDHKAQSPEVSTRDRSSSLRSDDLAASAAPEAPPKAKRSKARTAINETTQPEKVDINFAVSHGLINDDLRREWRAFRDHHVAKGSLMADWHAAWRTWVGNASRFRPSNPPPRGGGPVSITRIIEEKNAEDDARAAILDDHDPIDGFETRDGGSFGTLLSFARG